MGLQYLSTKNNELTNPYYGDAEGLGRIFKNMSSFFSFTSNQILAWKKSYGAHNLDAFIAMNLPSIKCLIIMGRNQ